jgi:hypothetical protein
MSQLTNHANKPVVSWVDYKPGDYEKQFYDIKTMAHHTYYGCWPNAGSFNVSKDGYVDEHFVLKVRPSKLGSNGLPERTDR